MPTRTGSRDYTPVHKGDAPFYATRRRTPVALARIVRVRGILDLRFRCTKCGPCGHLLCRTPATTCTLSKDWWKCRNGCNHHSKR